MSRITPDSREVIQGDRFFDERLTGERRPMHIFNHFRGSLAVIGVLAVAACADIASVSPEADIGQPSLAVEWAGNPELAKIVASARAATSKYHDESVAIADGYRPTSVCESSSIGAMGLHYNKPSLLGVIPGSSPLNGSDAVFDPTRPEVVLYEPQADGTKRLVAIEYVVFRSAWDALHSAPPTLAGIPFDQRFGSNAHGISDHYELHLWLWRENPLGVFRPYNPNVSCL
jgi:hypothetical protein